MFDTLEAEVGHREAVLDLPRPTDRPGVWGFRALGLPAVVVSWSSLVVTLLTFLGLQATATLRSLFRLPVLPELPTVAAAAIAAFVAHRCRERPGRRFPRYWCLGLCGAALVIAGFGWLDPVPGGAPWRHAAAVALIAGALALTPRLVRVRPESALAEWAAPLAAVGAVAVLVPTLLAGRWMFLQQIGRLGETVTILETWAATVDEIGGTDWVRLDRDPSVADRVGTALEELDPGSLPLDRSVWRTAEILGRGDELARAMADLSAASVAALAPERVPRVSLLREPAVSWQPERKEWLAYEVFGRTSELVGRYHRRLGELFAALDPVLHGFEAEGGRSAALAHYRTVYRRHGADLRDRLDPRLRPWADRWAVARVPAARAVPGAIDPPLAEVLTATLGPAGAESVLVPADFWHLMELGLRRAREVAGGTPGCHLREHREAEAAIARFECYAYAPLGGDGAEGAELSIEMRVVYVGEAGRLAEFERPSEIYFLFPVPAGLRPEDHLRSVAEAVARAVADRWSGGFELLDRSGSALHGFILKGESRDLIVYRPRLEPFAGEQRVVAVRGEWRGP